MAVLNGLLEPYFIDFAEEAGALDEEEQIIRLIELYLIFMRDNAGSIRFFVAQLLHDEQPSDGLASQVMQLYDGYRTLLVDLIGRAQASQLCLRDFPPQAVASMLLATLNGLLIGFLFSGDQAVQVESAVTMIGQWLFHENPHAGSGGMPPLP
jgi:hypothetical protein